MTTGSLRNEFRKDPRLPILAGDDNFTKLIRKGVREGDYVYKSGELLVGPGDPDAVIRIDERELKPGPLYTKARTLYWDFAHAVKLAA